ncbi:sugar transferase [Omnitrophica bacterium]|nr:sugar transferase [Candidatus Omnitrophota bacterium]
MNQTISKRSILLLILDLNVITFAYLIAITVHLGRVTPENTKISFLLLSGFVFSFIFYMCDLYYPYRLFTKLKTFINVVLGVTAGSLLLAAISYTDRTFVLSRYVFFYTSLLIIPMVYMIRTLYDGIFLTQIFDKKTLILGTGHLAKKIASVIQDTPNPGIHIIGFVSIEEATTAKNGRYRTVGNIKDLLSLIDWYRAELMILAAEPTANLPEMSIMSKIFTTPVMVINAIQLYENIKCEVPFRLMEPHYLVGLMSQVNRNPFLKIKFILDMIISLLLLVTLMPVLVISAGMVVLLEKQSPLLFQSRIGLKGKKFNLLKLKTMRETKRGKMVATNFGKWLRRYRIDEIPQLINVIKGDMSLIGPRPEIPYFVERSRKRIPFYDAVFTIKPGLTGWAQVLFHHSTSVRDYEQKFRYNLYYLKNLSFGLDLLIFIKTIRSVILGRGK